MIAKSEKLEWVDTARGLAICLVFVFHWYLKMGLPFDPAGVAHWFFLNGNYGVQLFFVASAYTLMMSADREFGRTQQIDWRKFYVRRFFRIAPAYYMAALFYTLWRIYLGNTFDHSVADFAKVLTFINGFFVTGQNGIVPGSWSISAEYFFYMLFPLIWFLSGRVLAIAIFFVIVFPVSVFGTKLISQYYLGDASGGYAFYHPLGWPPVFVLGVVAYKWLVPMARARNMKASPLLAVAAGMLIVHYLAQDHFKIEYFWIALVWCVLIVSMALAPSQAWTRPLQFIGRLSFAGYLVHFWALDVATRFGANQFAASQQTLHHLVTFSLAAALTVGLSYLVNIVIEQPGQNAGRYLISCMGQKRQLG